VNALRRIAALKREIVYRRHELVRLEKLNELGEIPADLWDSDFMKGHISAVKIGIEMREVEIQRLENPS
jgi:hypothetical protein